jgi:hypothetical protein
MKIIRERSQYDMESHRQRFMNNVIFQSTMKTNNLISTLKNKHVKMANTFKTNQMKDMTLWNLSSSAQLTDTFQFQATL